MKKTILIDFDGVIRHWTGSQVQDMHRQLGFENDVLFSCAFADEYLIPAITGQISHAKWCGLVQEALSLEYGDNVSRKLVAAWSEASSDIDLEFLANIRNLEPDACLVLVTNATSQLDSDLAQAGITKAFDLIVNSSVVGVA